MQKYVTYSLLIFLLVGFVGGCSLKSELPQKKGKLFVIGGGSRPGAMVQQMINESGIQSGDGYGIVLPMASSIPDTSAYYGMLQFQEQGVNNIWSFNFSDDNLSTVKAKLDSLSEASLIYIPGGVQSRFMNTVNDTPGLEEAINEAYESGALVAGTSAGAAIMSQIMITGDQKKYPEYTTTFYHLEKDNIITEEGLGLLQGVIIDQHFIKRARNNRLLTAIMEFPDKVGIGIDESTALVVDGDKINVVGQSQVLVYRNNSGSVAFTGDKLGSRDISLQIYLPGETFSLDK